MLHDAAELPFAHDEVVRVARPAEERREYAGLAGPIIAIGRDEHGTVWYGVSFEQREEWLEFMAEELDSLGEFQGRRARMSHEHLRVRVNENGEGYIVGRYTEDA